MTRREVALAPLLRRLAETPAAMQRPPRRGRGGEVHVDAIVRDLLETRGADLRDRAIRRLLGDLAPGAKGNERTLRTTLVAAWLLDAPTLRGGTPTKSVVEFLAGVVPRLADAVEPSLFISDPDRREELARRALAALDLHPAGESDSAAADRLAALDSAGRSGFLREAWDRLKRAREVREAMRRREARESAARWGSE